ncbi:MULTISPECIES: pyridoxamine 5'-phosphate oxidase [Cyanophyceae]|uniref:pyridoxamine 5'-phosphate oxidase n=1 Tax=Cyanophyceae TaxID=3028117 RepID=UPI001687D653|nr:MULTISPECIES: pyridoxamine 5'-phosphate oxidase [Cyanophyceae]MBD1916897.1 pyridoxamine 5'-phosphate oxidase [Phormidium sp. FACHB-77]MBD2029903.1 pyridoxamine 5'-phosphate oxidase [Phormidium sp. FACHB-322]MBD2053099.1 pyridoxamine 5'-phosphate oxidase [Leptolyngbya sp. FACHB-60]
MDIGELRRDYSQRGLDLADLNSDPFAQFELWFQQAREAELLEPNALVLSTVSPEGAPYQRTVLLKYFDRDGFVFFTNYGSRKAQHIAENAQVSMLFPWYPLERQLAIAGPASKISAAESLRYFSSRPRGSQLGAWVSQQSSVIASRQLLEMQFEKMKEKFLNQEVPLPDFWGGYRVKPTSFEFWQGRPSRLHDRFLYSWESGKWAIARLSP